MVGVGVLLLDGLLEVGFLEILELYPLFTKGPIYLSFPKRERGKNLYLTVAVQGSNLHIN